MCDAKYWALLATRSLWWRATSILNNVRLNSAKDCMTPKDMPGVNSRFMPSAIENWR